LGDRIACARTSLTPWKSLSAALATRGAKGGVSASIRDAIPPARCRRKDVIFVETIGVGQDELEIAGLADLVVVVLIPEMGDEVQGMKAGSRRSPTFCGEQSDLPRRRCDGSTTQSHFQQRLRYSPHLSDQHDGVRPTSLMTSKSIGSKISATVTITGSGSAYCREELLLWLAPEISDPANTNDRPIIYSITSPTDR